MRRFIASLTFVLALSVLLSSLAIAQTLQGTKIVYTEEDKAQAEKKKADAKKKFDQNTQNYKQDQQNVQRMKEQQRMEQIKRVPK